ncbi:MAG: type II secretion system protein M [Kistimonas sp.]|nr:type II secretion system protein M [Kistimonas sp.]
MKNRAASKWYGWFERYVLSGISAVGEQLSTRIKPAQDRVQTYLERLTARERQVLVILFSFLSIVFLWYMVWLPVDRWSERAHDSLVQERELNDFLAANYGRAQEAVRRQRAAEPKDAAAIVARTGRSAGLDLARVQPGRQGVVSIWIDSAPWSRLSAWLVQLHNREQLEVKQIRVERTDQEGIVKSFIRLSR